MAEDEGTMIRYHLKTVVPEYLDDANLALNFTTHNTCDDLWEEMRDCIDGYGLVEYHRNFVMRITRPNSLTYFEILCIVYIHYFDDFEIKFIQESLDFLPDESPDGKKLPLKHIIQSAIGRGKIECLQKADYPIDGGRERGVDTFSDVVMSEESSAEEQSSSPEKEFFAKILRDYPVPKPDEKDIPRMNW